MRNSWYQQPLGVWLGLVVIGLGAWAQDVFGVVLGGVLAVFTLITTDRVPSEPEADAPEDASTQDASTQDEHTEDR